MRRFAPLLVTLALVVTLGSVATATPDTPAHAVAKPPASVVAPTGKAQGATDWRAANAAGDCGGVLAALPLPDTDLERLAAGRCLVRGGQPGRAVEVLTPLLEPSTDAARARLLPYARLTLAQAQLARDRASEAVTLLSGVDLPGSDDDLLRATAQVQAGRGLEAREALRGMLDGTQGAEARYWLARAAEDRGDPAAVGTYQAIWKLHPTSPWAERAAQRLTALKSPVPDYGTPEGRSLALARAQKLLAIRQASLAVPLLDAIHAQAPFTTLGSQLMMAHALVDARLHARALDWFARASAETASPGEAFAYALATARSGDYALAAERYAALAARWPTAAEADEATWKLPWMDYDAGRLVEAEEGMARYLAARPNGKFTTDARWFRAWAAWRRGDRTTALARFDEVVRAAPTSDLALAARYWKARATDDTNALRQLLRESPDSGYAYFAAERLGVSFPARDHGAPPPVPDSYVRARPVLATGLALAEAGFVEWARPLVKAGGSDARGAGADVRIGMAHALVATEDYQGAKALAAGLCTVSTGGITACTPRPHAAAVRAVADSLGLPPLLPYAIMNAESGLDPSVTSPVGARGLMQLMPDLATGLAKDDLAGFVIDDLYRAGVNARLGTKELGLLHRTFSNRRVSPALPLVIAGYNGGAPAVERWLAGYPTAPAADQFAEDIGYTETRRYVRRVLGYYMQYRRVYGDG